MLRIRDLSFSYPRVGNFSLNLPELHIKPGEKIALMGPSGSGKTTLISLISGILRPSMGSIRIGEFDLTQAPDAQLREFRITSIGFVFQEFFLLEYLSAWENLLLPYFLNPVLVLDREVEDNARTIASRFGIADKLGRYPGELSQGERQRVAIGRAIVTRPLLLIADEPTANLDTGTARVVMDLLLDDIARRGRTFLMVTHDHSFFPLFDRVIDVSPFVRSGKTA